MQLLPGLIAHSLCLQEHVSLHAVTGSTPDVAILVHRDVSQLAYFVSKLALSSSCMLKQCTA